MNKQSSELQITMDKADNGNSGRLSGWINFKAAGISGCTQVFQQTTVQLVLESAFSACGGIGRRIDRGKGCQQKLLGWEAMLINILCKVQILVKHFSSRWDEASSIVISQNLLVKREIELEIFNGAVLVELDEQPTICVGRLSTDKMLVAE